MLGRWLLYLVVALLAAPWPAWAAEPDGDDESKEEVRRSPRPRLPETPPPPGYRRHPLLTTGVRAPAPRVPSAAPDSPQGKRSLSDALTSPMEFGSVEGGFEPPDWNDPDTMFSGASGAWRGDLEIYTNPQLRLGELQATMDRMERNRTTGVIHGEGNVFVEQGQSTLRAEAFSYYPPEESEGEPEPTIFEQAMADESVGKRQLTTGRITLTNMDLREPARDLKAKALDYDFTTGSGHVAGAEGRAGMYFFGAEEVDILDRESMEARDVWVTTCDHDPPHYRIRLGRVELREGEVAVGTNTRLQLGRLDTPIWLPKWRRGPIGGYPWTVDYDTGRRAALGYFLNVGQSFELTPGLSLGPRIMVTEKEGVGFGGDLLYDFMAKPASPLFRAKGEAHGLYTTEERGYLHFYHRYEYGSDLVIRGQAEQWSDEEFYKDFFFEDYRRRTTPRTFLNATYRHDAYVATATAQANTHAWITETERLPEASFHLLERPLADRLLVSADTVTGYYSRQQHGADAVRTANSARLTLDWDPLPALSVTPFWEVEGTWYSRRRDDDNESGRLTTTLGLTTQTRLHRAYPGRWGFSGFKHILVPSVTYSYRPGTSIDPYETPRFDALDTVYGRTRLEMKLDNVLYGRDAETSQVWQVGRVTFYQGTDFWSEVINSEDYEVEMDLRPRPWWGFQLAGERHVSTNESDTIREAPLQRWAYDTYERITGRRPDGAVDLDINDVFGDYNRVLAQLYYDDTQQEGRVNGRIGFAYTETQGEIYNREILYGIGYKLGDKWGVGLEHIYDFENGELRTQTYEVRRSLHCWEAAMRFHDRESGFDVDIEFSIKAFPGTALQF